ncbi:MAG: hypothetical protein WD512_16375 [Candidatus Paceibacterota bacterium]
MNIKSTIFVLFCFFGFGQLNAQISFKNNMLSKNEMSTTVDVFAGTWIYNLSNLLDTIVWTRSTNTLSDPAWTSAVCDIILCHPPDVSTNEF